jgi:cationic peptide transport system substrate-binding protein
MARLSFFQVNFFGLMLIVLAGCEFSPPQHAEDTLVYCSDADPLYLNPQLTLNSATIDATSYTFYNRLLHKDDDTAQIDQGLAINWVVSKNSTVFKIQLRPNVAFHTTSYFKPTRFMNAQDVLFSFNRMIDPKHPFHDAHPTNYPFFSDDFLNNIESLRAIDDLWVEFRLKSPNPKFLKHLTFSSAVILSQEYAEQLLAQNKRQDMDLKPIGTGAFKLEKYKRYEYIYMTKHEQYWNASRIFLKRLIYDITQENRGRISKVYQGDCDIAATPRVNDLPNVIRDARFKFRSKPGMNTSFLGFNTSQTPFNNINVRKAIAYAINKQNIIRAIYYYTAEEANTIIPKAAWSYTAPVEKYDYEPNRTKFLLDQEGISDLEFDLWVDESPHSYNPNLIKTAEIIRASLKALGITMNIHVFDDTLLRSSLNDERYDAFLMGWEDTENELDFFYKAFFSCNNSLSLQDVWCHEPYAKLIKKMQKTYVRTELKSLYKQAEQIIFDEIPIVPLAHAEKTFIRHRRVQDFEIKRAKRVSFRGVSVDNDEHMLPLDQGPTL